VLVAPLPAEDQADGCEYALTAGFTRYAACEKLGHDSIFATCRDAGENAAATPQLRAVPRTSSARA
jgi:hypothetical protein